MSEDIKNENPNSLISKELNQYIGERQRAFTKQLKSRAEKEGVNLDIRIQIAVSPLQQTSQLTKGV